MSDSVTNLATMSLVDTPSVLCVATNIPLFLTKSYTSSAAVPRV